MEGSLASLTFKGSIAEAIFEAKTQRKLFVVYISGDNPESIRLNESTWTNSCVAESLLKYCILLHISEGSNEAVQFFAIYPQKSVPCITAIGYNGARLWQNEGFVAAETLASNLEKAWFGLHIQEASATVLTAALTSNDSSIDKGSSSADKHFESIDSRPSSTSEKIDENKSSECRVEENAEVGDKLNSESIYASEVQCSETELSASPNQNTEVLNCPVTISEVSKSNVTNEEKEVVQENNDEAVEEKKNDGNDGLDKCLDVNNKSSDVYLNIRLPNGSSLREKFSVISTLGMVKDHVDINQDSGSGPYDLAIPYPRKVFNDQDLMKSLSELELYGRQALIVVPRQRASVHYNQGSSSHKQTNLGESGESSTGSNGGFLAHVMSVLSYMNPFSYVRGTASSTSKSRTESDNGMWQYRPGPALENNLRDTDGRYTHDSPSQSSPATGRNDNSRKKPTAARFGSNIHTLKHDEEDKQFGDRNAFWNGNSTQYGGDNEGR